MTIHNDICLSDWLSYQSVIGKRRGIDCSAGQIVEELVLVPASVETERDRCSVLAISCAARTPDK
jgi:hypothetical protein